MNCVEFCILGGGPSFWRNFYKDERAALERKLKLTLGGLQEKRAMVH